MGDPKVPLNDPSTGNPKTTLDDPLVEISAVAFNDTTCGELQDVWLVRSVVISSVLVD